MPRECALGQSEIGEYAYMTSCLEVHASKCAEWVGARVGDLSDQRCPCAGCRTSGVGVEAQPPRATHVAFLHRPCGRRGARECRGGIRDGLTEETDSAAAGGVDRRCRFDLREGHDLERLLWPGTGSGDSTGLLQNSPSTAGASRRTDSLNRRRCASSSTADHRTCIGKMSVRHHRAKADDNGVAYRPRDKKSGPTADAMGPEQSVRLPGILRMLRGPAFRPRPCRGPVRGPTRAGAPRAW
jgi:hypothetical protein